jgi:hypothetical protein
VLTCAFLVAFFPILANCSLGLASADRNLVNLFLLYGASRWQTLVMLKLPAALPYFFTGLRIGGGLALIGAIVAELAAGAAGQETGLAFRIVEAGHRLEIPRMFAALTLISLTGIAIFFTFSALSRLALRHWHESADVQRDLTEPGAHQKPEALPPRGRLHMKMHGNRSAACLSLACLGLAILAPLPSQVAAKTFSNVEAAAGQWDMSLGATDRTCRMTLEAGTASGGPVDMPALCRRSLPILIKVGAWNLPKTDDIELADASGKPILDFVARSEAALSASGPEGETYALVPVNAPGDFKFEPENVSGAPGFDVVQATPPTPSESRPPENSGSTPPANPAASTAPAKSAVPPPKPSAAASAMKPGDVAGRYSVEREADKDASCLLILNDQAKAQGGYKASLGPACRDQGIMIFDPVGWRLANGRLVLTARRGHTTHLDLQPDGTWLKDPNEGKPLTLKKL